MNYQTGFITKHPFIFYGIIIFLILLIIGIIFIVYRYSKKFNKTIILGSGISTLNSYSPSAPVPNSYIPTSAIPISNTPSASKLQKDLSILGCTLDPNTPNYIFCQGRDSNGGNIIQNKTYINNIPGSVKYCNNLTNCSGFNTNGSFKLTIIEPSKWSKIPNSSPTQGIYLKNILAPLLASSV